MVLVASFFLPPPAGAGGAGSGEAADDSPGEVIFLLVLRLHGRRT